MTDYKLEKVLPGHTAANITNMLKRDTIYFSQTSMGVFAGSIQFFNFHNFFGGQFAHTVSFPNVGKSMSNLISLIVGTSSPSKVFKSIVYFVSVRVTCFFPCSFGAYECIED